MQRTQIPATRAIAGLETINQFADTNAKANLYPSTRWAVRGMLRYREAHGITEAFVRVGRRVLIDRQRFYELLTNGKPRRQHKGIRA
ncbi:MAG TPA: hypothetical protein VGL34_28520 [Steroidobacteraceae bacterium]|jgi:hypothetical protein